MLKSLKYMYSKQKTDHDLVHEKTLSIKLFSITVLKKCQLDINIGLHFSIIYVL